MAKSSDNACRATAIQEFLKFLRTVEAGFPPGLELHLILDNYGTHKHPKVQQWLAKRPRFKLHFTPTSASWTNLVERWFRELTEKAIRRGPSGAWPTWKQPSKLSSFLFEPRQTYGAKAPPATPRASDRNLSRQPFVREHGCLCSPRNYGITTASV